MSSQLLSPDDHTLVLVDQEGQMALAVGSHPLEVVLNATAGLARTAALFEVPTIVTTASRAQLQRSALPCYSRGLPGRDRPDSANDNEPWEDSAVRHRNESSGCRKVVFAGLWAEVCVAMPAIAATEGAFEAYVVCDACGGVSPEAHQRAVARLVQAGVRPLTWLQYMLELQRDWARHETSNKVRQIAREHADAHGIGIDYIYTMLEWDRERRT